MNVRMKVAAVVVFIVVGAVGVGVWKTVIARPPAYCQLSGRIIRPHMLTVVKVNDKKLYTCCARCPLTYARATGKRVEILEVTDFETGRRLSASEAWFVDGSPVEPCCAPAIRSEDERTPYVRVFDRCAPSLLAFASKQEALDFIEQHGGALKRLSDLMNTLHKQVGRR